MIETSVRIKGKSLSISFRKKGFRKSKSGKIRVSIIRDYRRYLTQFVDTFTTSATVKLVRVWLQSEILKLVDC